MQMRLHREPIIAPNDASFFLLPKRLYNDFSSQFEADAAAAVAVAVAFRQSKSCTKMHFLPPLPAHTGACYKIASHKTHKHTVKRRNLPSLSLSQIGRTSKAKSFQDAPAPDLWQMHLRAE